MLPSDGRGLVRGQFDVMSRWLPYKPRGKSFVSFATVMAKTVARGWPSLCP